MSAWAFPLKDGETLEALQDKFARLWAQLGEELQAIQIAADLFPNDADMSRAWQASVQWRASPSVLLLRNKYRLEGVRDTRMTIDEARQHVEAIIRDPLTKNGERLKAMAELRELNGWVQVPDPLAGNSTGKQRVFLFREFPADFKPGADDLLDQAAVAVSGN